MILHSEYLDFRTRPSNSVLFLGAGASKPSGAPLINEFVERSIDLQTRGSFKKSESFVVSPAIDYYHGLRSQLALTELDIDNIENLLAMAIHDDLIIPPKKDEPSRRILVTALIELVLNRSITLPRPSSPYWLGIDKFPEAKLIGRLAAYNENDTSNPVIITTNYDCILEYIFHCLGVSYTYNRDVFKGDIEILKLHGSLNWQYCPNPDCEPHHQQGRIRVSRIGYDKIDVEFGLITVRNESVICPGCRKFTLQPLVVPPIGGKAIDNPALVSIWKRTHNTLWGSEIFAAIGYSLPLIDVGIRQLLHRGFSSGNLRRALIVIGDDGQAQQRWNALFRPTWGDRRLSIMRAKYSAVAEALREFFVIPPNYGEHIHGTLLPIGAGLPANLDGLSALKSGFDELGLYGEKSKEEMVDIVDWTRVAKDLRESREIGRNHEILRKANLDWVPDEEIVQPTFANPFYQE